MKHSFITISYIGCVAFVSLVALCGQVSYDGQIQRNYCQNPPMQNNLSIVFSRNRYPNISQHILDAQHRNHPSRLRLQRNLANLHRRQSLRGWPSIPGMDRDEYPPAMTTEGGLGADVRYVPSSENRSAGAWMRAQLRNYPDLWCIRFTVQ